MERTLQDALETIFGQAPRTQEDAPGGPDQPGEGEPEDPGATDDERIQQLLDDIDEAYEKANAALEEQDLGEYQEQVAEAERLTETLQNVLADDDEPDTTTTTTEPDEA
jgi:hypothetical protein